MELNYALTQIADIRRQMQLARRFHGFRAASTLATGIAAVGAGIWQAWRIPNPSNDPLYFVALWASVAVASVILCAGELGWRYRNSDSPAQQELAILAVEQFFPFVLAGGLLTFVLSAYALETIWMLPGLWQILFGLGVFSLRRLSPRPIVFVGAFYVLCGMVNLSGGLMHLSPWSMVIPFGAGQVACAIIFYWYLERQHAA